jgi:hypothetical protein
LGKPGPKCTVCTSPHRAQIDIGLVNGLSCKSLAERFGLGTDAVERHSNNHLLPQQRAAILSAQNPTGIDLEQLKVSEAEGLLSHVLTQRSRLHTLGELALEFQDIKAAVSVEAAIGANLSLAAKLLGQLVSVHDHRHTSLLLTPDYLRLREVLVTTLRAFPEAGRAVAAALHAIESEAAADITSRAARPKPAPVAVQVIEHVPTPPPPPIYVDPPPIVPPAAPLPPPPPSRIPPPPPWPGGQCS